LWILLGTFPVGCLEAIVEESETANKEDPEKKSIIYTSKQSPLEKKEEKPRSGEDESASSI
jgi:hypothetical protein